MGKSKKTRWRTFEIAGSQDETQTNGADVKINGTDSESPAPVSSQKYSQILGDHHTNNSAQNKTSSQHIYKSRGYNNKENFYNQRPGGRLAGSQRSWQRGGNYRTPVVNGKDRRGEENEKANDAKVDSTAEPIKFNEDEYTRITTPRQDVLFKKGYLSRMNNKTASNLSATVNSTESTAASSTITTSDPDSSVSTLSPATTPSMEFGQVDSMDMAPMYYPGYYDENGLLVIPMYNGYNYYPPNGSAATSPVFLMPYPYQYDPFFMTPSGLQPVDGDESHDDKTESDGAPKENNQNAENQNGSRSTSSSEDGAGSNHGEEIKDEKKEVNGIEDAEAALHDADPSDQKQSFPIYPNELNGYMYPAYPNGYYNNFYYYNGAPSRPPKMRRRKRFLNARNSHQQPRSAETTTDYSDDDNSTYTRRFNPRYQNGWAPNGYCNGKFHRVYMDQNANQTPNEFHLNVDVQEFYPRVQLPDMGTQQVNCESSNDLERKETASKQKAEAPKVTKASQQPKSTSRVTKKEIIEGIKSMEQQNIDLMATKRQTVTSVSQSDEWNVIKKGKKVKVVKDIKMELSSSDVFVDLKKDKIEETKIEQPKETALAESVPVKKPQPAVQKSKKPKGKKKKKPNMSMKQNGFEIIEPEFNHRPAAEEASPEMSDDEETQQISEPEAAENVVLEETVVEVETASPEVNDLPQISKTFERDDDDVIDISDEDICCIDLIEIERVNEDVKALETEKEVTEIELEVQQAPEEVVKKVLEVQKIEIDESKTSETQELKVETQEVKVEAAAVKVIVAEVEVLEAEPEDKVLVAEPQVKILETKPEVKEPATEPQPVEEKQEVQVITTQTQIEPEVHKKPDLKVKIPECGERVKKEVQQKSDVQVKPKLDPFLDSDYFNDRTNIAALERDLMENLRLLDDDFDLKSPIINPLYDFPITSAVQKWLQDKQNESFDSLFHVQNLKKLRELYQNDDEDETESDISEKEIKSESDSDYASDFQAKASGGSPTCSTIAKGSSKCNKLIAKESFCALM